MQIFVPGRICLFEKGYTLICGTNQGDGSAQLLATSAAGQRAVVEILREA